LIAIQDGERSVASRSRGLPSVWPGRPRAPDIGAGGARTLTRRWAQEHPSNHDRRSGHDGAERGASAIRARSLRVSRLREVRRRRPVFVPGRGPASPLSRRLQFDHESATLRGSLTKGRPEGHFGLTMTTAPPIEMAWLLS